MHRLSSAAKPYLAETLAAIRTDAVIYPFVAVYLVIGAAYVLGRGDMLFGDFGFYASACLIVCCVVLPYVVLIIGMIRITLRLKGRRRLAYRYMFAPRRVARFIAGTLLTLLMLVLFEEMFTSVKSALSSGAFGYDRLAADIDKFIHFGHAPVKYLMAVAKNEWLLRILEFNYHEIWVPIWFGTLYWVAISPRTREIRVRYCISFVLVWAVVGNLVAGLLPTAGPAFYGLATGDTSRFTQLRAFLDGASNSFSSTASTQHYLWALHETGASDIGSGISAFPSMHVAIIAMNALFLAERGWRLGTVGALYTLVIMFSSVYLGWHYAIDGYVAVLLTIGIYWATKRYTPALERLMAWRPAPRATDLVPVARESLPEGVTVR